MKVKVRSIERFMLCPGMGQPARFAQNGELFAHIVLDKRVCEDTTEGRLILFNVNSLLLLPVSADLNDQSAIVSFMSLVMFTRLGYITDYICSLHTLIVTKRASSLV